MNPVEESDCDWGCTSDLGIHTNCPKHNPIDIKHHDAVLLTQEPIRADLRIANTTQALRAKVLAAGNGHRVLNMDGVNYI